VYRKKEKGNRENKKERNEQKYCDLKKEDNIRQLSEVPGIEFVCVCVSIRERVSVCVRVCVCVCVRGNF